jgi:hypothetical protein
VRHFREPVYEQVAKVLDAYWRPDVTAATKIEILRLVIDTVQTSVGENLLRGLPHTRAYHLRSGALGETDELLLSGPVMRLIRETTGMAAEPGQPIERTARRGISRRRK